MTSGSMSASASIEVEDGVVSLDGTLDRRSEKELVEKWARLADGVVVLRAG